MQNVYAHDAELMGVALEKMSKINNLEIYGSMDEKDRMSVITLM